MRVVTGALLLGLTAACQKDLEPAEGHVVVHLDTDAPLRVAEADGGQPRPGLFDTLQVVAIGADGRPVPGTLRELALVQEMFRNGPVSFGVVPATKTARVVLEFALFRAAQKSSRFPADVMGLAVRASFPPTGEIGQQIAFLLLHTDDTGLRRGWGQPLDVELEVPSESLVGSWQHATAKPCSTEAASGEVCIPGGAFWMGDPELRGNADLGDSDREHLVVLRPFFLDSREVTVAEFRERWPELEGQGLAPPPTFSGDDSGDDPGDFSTFSPTPADAGSDVRADFPVNGVPWATARAYCSLVGKDLPSAAMLEYVASGLGSEQSYAWGFDVPECEDAVIARGGFGYYSNTDGSCRKAGTIGGPEPSTREDRDRVVVGDDEAVVLDLAGNLSEWTLDAYVEQSEQPETLGVIFDPVAEAPVENEQTQRVVKGGSWRGKLVEARAGAHSGRDPLQQNRSIGFRCARRDEPGTP